MGDFIDGFELVVPDDITGMQLQRGMKESGLDVMSPLAKRARGSFWFQLASGPGDLASVMPSLKRVRDTIEDLREVDIGLGDRPVLTKLDFTRDLSGSFYAPKDWKSKHRELALALEQWFACPFRDNGNSFDSCFQFEAQQPREDLKLRVKYYWKGLALL